MIDLNECLKDLLTKEYNATQVKKEYGNLTYNGIKFSIGEVSNPYLLYKYALWYNDGKNHSIPLKEDYNCPMLHDFINKILGLTRIKIEEPTLVEKEFTGGLFDFL